MKSETLLLNSASQGVAALAEEILLIELSAVAPNVGDSYIGALMRVENLQAREAAKDRFEQEVNFLVQQGLVSSPRELEIFAEILINLTGEDRAATIAEYRKNFAQNFSQTR